MMTELQTIIEAAWDARDGISPATTGEVRDAVVALADVGHVGAHIQDRKSVV